MQFCLEQNRNKKLTYELMKKSRAIFKLTCRGFLRGLAPLGEGVAEDTTKRQRLVAGARGRLPPPCKIYLFGNALWKKKRERLTTEP